jgi:starch phosphorylase
MWRPLFRCADAADVPIGHVTNGAHVPTWVSPPLARLLERHLGPEWLRASGDPATWEGVRAIPNAELWEARCEARRGLVDFVQEKGGQDLLLRGERIEEVRALGRVVEPDVLTLGFARRLATYKRLHLLIQDVDRARRILRGERPVQLLVAGKAHPADDDGKRTLQRILNLRHDNGRALERLVFVEDYDTEIARHLVAGCDVWVNLPRKPMEASGTSGMKSAFNGGLQLSVLDGWWAEGFDGANGWGIPGDEADDPGLEDAADARRFYDLLEEQVIPLFYDRGEDGVPHGWCELVKQSLVTCGPAFSATRMVDEYAARMYPASP